MPSGAAYRTAEGGLEHLDLHRAGDLAACLRALEPHYRTVAAALADDAVPLSGLPRDRPIALVLGNEERGVSPEALGACSPDFSPPSVCRVSRAVFCEPVQHLTKPGGRCPGARQKTPCLSRRERRLLVNA